MCFVLLASRILLFPPLFCCCVTFTHTLDPVCRLAGQSFEAEPAPEHSELIILTSYCEQNSPPSRPCSGTENSFVESLRRTWRIRNCLKSTANDVSNRPGNHSAARVSEQWSGNEFMGLKLAALFSFFSPSEEENPRIQIWAAFQELVGGSLYVTNMIFYPFDRMSIYAAIFQICQGPLESPHLGLTFKSSPVGDLNPEWCAGINHCMHFDLDGSHTSPILLCPRIRLI